MIILVKKCENNIEVFQKDLEKNEEESKCLKCELFINCSEEETILDKQEFMEHNDPNNLRYVTGEIIKCDHCSKNLKKTDSVIEMEVREERDNKLIKYIGIKHFHKACWDFYYTKKSNDNKKEGN